MIFTISGVDALSRWEIAEYVSEGIVIVGCVGELVADVCKRLPRRIMQSVFSAAARRRDALGSTGFDGRAGALKTDWAKRLHCSRPYGH